jgi:hypothetical protein
MVAAEAPALESARDQGMAMGQDTLAALEMAEIAASSDPLHSLPAAAQLVQRASAGVVVRADGETAPLPGMGGHELLVPGSPALAVARAELDAGRLHRSFL